MGYDHAIEHIKEIFPTATCINIDIYGNNKSNYSEPTNYINCSTKFFSDIKRNNMSNLTLIRGLPGSGKSTLAKQLFGNTTNTYHLETDQWFVDAVTGIYEFKPELVSSNHAKCLLETETHLNTGSNVIVSNTFVQMWEIQKYADLLRDGFHSLSIVECSNCYGSEHDVPLSTILRMKDNWVNVRTDGRTVWEIK